jgi:hypothetical protein
MDAIHDGTETAVLVDTESTGAPAAASPAIGEKKSRRKNKAKAAKQKTKKRADDLLSPPNVILAIAGLILVRWLLGILISMFTPDSYPPPPPPPPRFRRPPSPPPVPSPPPPWLIDPCNKQGTFSFLLRCTPSPPPHAPQLPSAPPPGAPPPSPSPPPPPSPPFIAPPPAEPPTKPPLAFPPQPPFIRVQRAATPKAVAEAINGDYREATKGLLVHQFDETEDKQRPWRGCPNGIARPRAGDECARFGSRLSALILSRKIVGEGGGLFSGTKSGIILSQGAVVVRCCYGGDGGTRGSPDGCKGFDWCPEGRLAKGDVWCGGKPHRPTDLPALLTFRVPPSGYHEIIVDARSLEVHLPDTVLAFFYPSNGAGKNTAARAREAFLREYPEVQPDSLPLLRYNPALKEEPFEAD